MTGILTITTIAIQSETYIYSIGEYSDILKVALVNQEENTALELELDTINTNTLTIPNHVDITKYNEIKIVARI